MDPEFGAGPRPTRAELLGTDSTDAEGGGDQCLAPRGGDIWVVKRGDTLWAIARQVYGDGALWPRIRDANLDRVFNGGNLILVGTELVLPDVEEGADAGDAAGDAPQALEPRLEATEYGTYEVYPDDAPLSLLPAARTDATIPIIESDFAALRHLMDGILGDSAGIDISGADEFRAAVLADFGWLLSQPVGRQLITSIIAAGQTVTIEATGGGNSASYGGDGGWENADGTPGTGVDVTVNYNTSEWNPYGGADAWMRRPPAIGLAHELIHAWTGVTGTRARGTEGGVRRREQQATGLGDWEDAALTENRFRQAFGLPLRPRY